MIAHACAERTCNVSHPIRCRPAMLSCIYVPVSGCCFQPKSLVCRHFLPADHSWDSSAHHGVAACAAEPPAAGPRARPSAHRSRWGAQLLQSSSSSQPLRLCHRRPSQVCPLRRPNSKSGQRLYCVAGAASSWQTAATAARRRSNSSSSKLRLWTRQLTGKGCMPPPNGVVQLVCSDLKQGEICSCLDHLSHQYS